jgi:hypothetical protein
MSTLEMLTSVQPSSVGPLHTTLAQCLPPRVLEPLQAAVGIYCHLQVPHGTAFPFQLGGGTANLHLPRDITHFVSCLSPCLLELLKGSDRARCGVTCL